MKVTIEKVKDLEELARFLSLINQHKTLHIGYCGVQMEEIYKTLREDFVSDDGDIHFFIARSHTADIIGAIGIDVDGSSAEVWGPFTKVSSRKLSVLLWEQLVNEHPTIQAFHFFINKLNIEQQVFLNDLGAKNTGEHLILEIKAERFQNVSEFKSTMFNPSDFPAFEKLHSENFPNTYYDAKTIKEKLDDEKILRVLKTDINELIGYAYYEVDIEMAEASLEYIVISREAQNQGHGSMLLKEVLTHIFSYPQINEVSLSVSNNNSRANHLYLKNGFKRKDILMSFVLKCSRRS